MGLEVSRLWTTRGVHRSVKYLAVRSRLLRYLALAPVPVEAAHLDAPRCFANLLIQRITDPSFAQVAALRSVPLPSKRALTAKPAPSQKTRVVSQTAASAGHLTLFCRWRSRWARS